MKLFGEFVPGVDSWLSVSIMNTKEDIDDDGYGYLARPMGQLYNFSIFFQDYVPKFPAYRVHCYSIGRKVFLLPQHAESVFIAMLVCPITVG